MQTADSSNQPIFPEYRSPTEWPWAVNLMVAEARRILSYLTNVPKKALPPKAIWHSPDRCAEFIEEHMKFDSNENEQFIEFQDDEMQ